MALQLKLDTLRKKYNDNIENIATCNSQIHSLCTEYNEEASSISTQINQMITEINDIKEKISSNDTEIIAYTDSIKLIPGSMKEIIANEERIYNNEMTRISAKLNILQNEFKSNRLMLDDQRNTACDKINSLKKTIEQLDALAFNNINLRHIWKTTIHRKLADNKMKKLNADSVTAAKNATINQLNEEITEIKRDIESKKLLKYNANGVYYTLMASLNTCESSLIDVNSKISDLISGVGMDVNGVNDFEGAMNTLQSLKKGYECDIIAIKNNPVFNINTYLDGIQSEIDELLNQIQIIEYKINYYLQEDADGSEGGDYGFEGEGCSEDDVSKKLIELKVNRKNTQKDLDNAMELLNVLENDMKTLEDNYKNASSTLEEQRDRAQTRWDIMKSRTLEEAETSRNDTQTKLDELKLNNKNLNYNRLKLENEKVQLLAKLQSLLNVESSARLTELRNSIIKLEQANNIVIKEMDLIQNNMKK